MTDDRSTNDTAGGFGDAASNAGAAMKATGEKMAEGGSAVGLKVIDHVEENVREALAAMRAAAQAKDPSQLMKIQGDYMRDQGNRAMAQVREMGELIMQFGRESTASFRGPGGGKDAG